MDEILGPPGKAAPQHWRQDDGDQPYDQHVIERLLEQRQALVTSNGYLHSIRHPIRDREGGVAGGTLMAEAVTSGGMLEIHEELLRSKDLRLMQHFARRTDPSPPDVLPPKGAFGSTPESPDPGWHVVRAHAPARLCAPPLTGRARMCRTGALCRRSTSRRRSRSSTTA